MHPNLQKFIELKPKMDPIKAAAWVAALRSGEYTQVQGKLNTGAGHCCLGVMCEVAGIPSHLQLNGQIAYGEPNSVCVLFPAPKHFELALGFVGRADGIFNQLSSANDHGATFDGIADAIEQVIGQ